jgi:hypothetical protein
VPASLFCHQNLEWLLFFPPANTHYQKLLASSTKSTGKMGECKNIFKQLKNPIDVIKTNRTRYSLGLIEKDVQRDILTHVGILLERR